jgi:hypothetical protein
MYHKEYRILMKISRGFFIFGGKNMQEFIPYEKLSKKKRRKLDLAKRQTWGSLNPVTRRPENSRAYNRNKARAGLLRAEL